MTHYNGYLKTQIRRLRGTTRAKKNKLKMRKKTERGLVPAPCLAYGNVAWPMHVILIMMVSVSPILSEIPSHFLHN